MEATQHSAHGAQEHRLPVILTKRKDVPQAPLYVTATLPHLSGWGEAEGKTARAVYPVPNHETARQVSAHIRTKLNAQRIHTCATRPEIRQGSVCILFDYTGLF